MNGSGGSSLRSEKPSRHFGGIPPLRSESGLGGTYSFGEPRDIFGIDPERAEDVKVGVDKDLFLSGAAPGSTEAPLIEQSISKGWREHHAPSIPTSRKAAAVRVHIGMESSRFESRG